ncbi:glutathione hydrolase 1 proenzyme-like [Diadema antillarum]|uniref:glutathione hydrolase 1 proenzyme-like n=1 Tax=Diadema antillarum TaxID=105358 RepID=UPI003A83923F
MMDATEMKVIGPGSHSHAPEDQHDLKKVLTLDGSILASLSSSEDEYWDTSDKHALIKSDGSGKRETEPLKDPVVIQREQICGVDGLRFIIISSVIFSVAITIGMIISILTGQTQVKSHGAVATSVEVCSEIGANTLRHGGHAIDAAVAATFCLGVVHGHYSGLGGGGFIIMGNPVMGYQAGYNFRETAPVASTADMFGTHPTATPSGLSVAVPGELMGLEMAWKQHGKLRWEDLVEPSVELARTGFKVTAQLAADIAEADFSSMSQNLRDLFENKVANDTIRRPSLARLLQSITTQGSLALYNGTVLQEIVDTVTDADGIMTVKDVENYEALPVEPIQSSYSHHQVYSLPSPSSGPEVLTILNALRGYNLTTPGSNGWGLEYHRLIEVSKFAAAMSRQLGDPEQTPIVANMTGAMLGRESGERIRDAVNDTATYRPSHYFEGDVLQPLSFNKATALVTVVDEQNNIVSLSSSLNAPFGSGLMTPSGIILNSAMNSFNWPGKVLSFEVPEANSIAPGRRPVSNMVPLVAWSSQNLCLSRFAVSGTGSSAIQSASVDVALKVMTFNQTLDEAVERRTRVFPSLYENVVEVEANLNASIVAELTALGHKVEVRQNDLGVANIASEVKDHLSAHSDSRSLGAEADFY